MKIKVDRLEKILEMPGICERLQMPESDIDTMLAMHDSGVNLLENFGELLAMRDALMGMNEVLESAEEGLSVVKQSIENQSVDNNTGVL